MFQPSLWRLRMQALGGLLSRYKAVWSTAWAQREQWERRHWTREEAEFLPPALSLQETPPSPAPRVAMWLLIAFAFIAVLWACFGRIDVVSVAQGKVVPSDHIKSIQPLQAAATVRAGVSLTLGAHLENLVLTGTNAINGTGNALDNTLTGNSARNVLDGGSGSDTVVLDAPLSSFQFLRQSNGDVLVGYRDPSQGRADRWVGVEKLKIAATGEVIDLQGMGVWQ